MRISKFVALGALAVGVSVAIAPKAQAAYITTLEQVGSNVVGTGSGSINTSALNLIDPGTSSAAGMAPSGGFMVLGPAGPEDAYSGFTAPTDFGGGGFTSYSSETGSAFLINTLQGFIGTPVGYASGTAFTSSATWDDTTLAELGVTDGTYVWTWGTGTTADSFTLDIEAAPEPASLVLLGTGLAALGLNRRRSPALSPSVGGLR